MKIELNQNFKRISESYLFSEISKRVASFKEKFPQRTLISLGIGDVTRPLSPSVASEMSRSAAQMGTKNGFFGYGDVFGLAELRQAITDRYQKRGVSLDISEIFINDGAKSDLANLCDVLGDTEALICDPVYPVYLDSSIMSGKRVRLISANEENGFLPTPQRLPKSPFVIYLCSPNNPTGAVFSRRQLKDWVDFANESGSLIIFDAAYEAYISDSSLPHSVFEIEGAKDCSIEVCSFSKSAGFTGVRCGWTAIPLSSPIHKLWARRQSTKFNGASYISQRGALAALSDEGMRDNRESISYYMRSSRALAELLRSKGIYFTGGHHAPYLWLKCPGGVGSWEFFDILLESAGVIGTPGSGFGKQGEGFFRLSSFASYEDTLEAISRMDKAL